MTRRSGDRARSAPAGSGSEVFPTPTPMSSTPTSTWLSRGPRRCPTTAEAAQKRLIAHDPQDPAAYDNLGTLRLRTRRYDEAASAYRQSLRYRTNHPATYLNLGAALKDGGRIGEAVAVWEQALRLAPGEPSVHAELARLGQSSHAWIDEKGALARRDVTALAP